ncbi:hypothetical protein C2845_PM13G10370 [Panicum miliaceum]|uniref:Uncharacterized protein n=1 Tax=Panicum miliaceum TaxID=4540 RepID=A0A3L6RL40_PANMI|nr:hypothetical protein C2845_PM13G10370 [Panicum miliaceum]
MKVKPDPEESMIEDAAIRIVLTLQSLYTCTHSGCKSVASRLRHILQISCEPIKTHPTTMTL